MTRYCLHVPPCGDDEPDNLHVIERPEDYLSAGELRFLADEKAEEATHRLFGSVCTCGDWTAGCGNDVPEQWRQHVNAADRAEAAPHCATCRCGEGER